MREIKFRAWDNNKETLCNITDINFSDYSANGVCFGEWSEFSVNNLMQYTGLKDKNGVIIFEGDIVYCNNAYYEVVWEESKAVEFRLTKQSKIKHPKICDVYFGFNASNYIEVVGNIYENPELLKGEMYEPIK